ncbi:WD40-repeat-containing domain protein [Chytridium lagenaria]|nr:WD40-repeat-containing domain protein [Chytridium lagenaria]
MSTKDLSDIEAGIKDLTVGGKKAPKSPFRTAQRFTANRPWAGAVVAPTDATALAKDALPKETLVLEYVHGFRTRDVSNTAFYLSPTTITFPAGSLAVVHTLPTLTQTFFRSHHKEDVTAIAVHPTKKYVATGDIASRTLVCTFISGRPLALKRDLSRVSFFRRMGKFLVAVLMDNEHSVCVYEWNKGEKAVAMDKIFGITRNPKNNNEFVTYGVKHLRIFGAHRSQSIMSCAFLPDGTYVTGTFGGDLLIWKKNNISKVMEKVHQGPIFSLAFSATVGLVTASKDATVVVHEYPSFKAGKSYKLDAGVRSTDLGSDGSLLVGLENSTLLEIKDVAKGGKVSIVLELWGLAMDPVNDSDFVTAGDDSMVFKRSIKEKKTLAKTKLEGKLRAAAYSPDAKLIAVGNDAGDLYLLKSADLSRVACKKYEMRSGVNSKIHAVEVIKFSPDGKYVAVGTHDDVIYVWENVLTDLKFLGMLKGHSSFVTHLDWSTDSTHIQSTSGDYELLFWNIPSLAQEKSASALKDTPWSTFTVPFGWPVQGIWEKGWDGTDINSVARNPAKTCLVTGDDFFNVRLLAYPAAKEEMASKKFGGHGSHVTRTLFSAKGTYLISTGGMDGCAFQWRVEKS